MIFFPASPASPERPGNRKDSDSLRIFLLVAGAFLLFLVLPVGEVLAQSGPSRVNRSLGVQIIAGMCKIAEVLNWIQLFAIAAGVVAVTILGILTYTGRFQLNKLLQYSGAVMLVAVAPALITFLIGDDNFSFCLDIALEVPYIT